MEPTGPPELTGSLIFQGVLFPPAPRSALAYVLPTGCRAVRSQLRAASYADLTLSGERIPVLGQLFAFPLLQRFVKTGTVVWPPSSGKGASQQKADHSYLHKSLVSQGEKSI